MIASIVWGFGHFLRTLVLDELSPLYINLISTAIVSLLFLFFYRISLRRIHEILSKNFVKCSLVGLFGATLGNLFMLIGLIYIELGIAGFLEKLQPIFTLFIARIYLGEKLSPMVLPYIALSLASSIFIAVRSPLQLSATDINAVGIICVVLASLCWAIASVVGKDLMRGDILAYEMVYIRFSLGFFFLIPMFFLPMENLQHFSPTVRNVTIVFAASVISTGFGFLVYYQALKSVSASIASLIELITPVVTMTLGYFFLKESYTYTQILASVLLLFCIYRVTTFDKSP